MHKYSIKIIIPKSERLTVPGGFLGYDIPQRIVLFVYLSHTP
jgi:hypothetical protein